MSVELCFTPQYAEEAFQDSHMGRKASVRPFVDGVIPTTLDKKLAPEGVHGDADAHELRGGRSERLHVAPPVGLARRASVV